MTKEVDNWVNIWTAYKVPIHAQNCVLEPYARANSIVSESVMIIRDVLLSSGMMLGGSTNFCANWIACGVSQPNVLAAGSLSTFRLKLPEGNGRHE